MSATERSTKESYTLAQIVLHWSIAVLVIWQLVFGENLPDAERVTAQGGTVDATTEFLASSHVWFGLAILGLVAIRLVLRLVHGAPSLAGEPPLTATLARIVHAAFYFLLVAVPLTGIADYYFGLPTGEIHTLGKPLFIILISLHVVAALWHQFIRHDGIMRRMLVPARQ